MLYDRWRQIAARFHDQPALHDIASKRSWTFGQLFAAGEGWPSATGEIVYPQGHTPEFILTVLSAWRDGKVVCPLEPDAPAPQVPRPPAECVHLKSTSATTAASRLVAFTAEQLSADVENIVATMGLRPDWPNLGIISMSHSYGFSNLVLPLLLHGLPLILVPSGLPESLRRAAAGQKALVLPAVPALWQAWHEAGAIPGNIRLAISAGAHLPLSLEQAIFHSSGLKVHNCYGSTECGGIAFDRSDTPRSDEALVGTALCNVRLVVGDNGCLQIQGAAVGETYWPSPSECLQAGRFQTGDLVEISDGAVFLRGRVTDFINVAGRKLSPSVLERMLIDHPAVAACLVFGTPSPKPELGDQIVACIVAHEPVTAGSLREFLSAKAPPWQIPKDWWFVDSLKPNRLGKISRSEWRARYLARRSH